MGMIFFKVFPGISNVSQIGTNKLFTIIKHQFDGSQIDSKTSNLSYFNMGFFIKAFSDITYITKWFKIIIYNNKMPTYTELMEILKANEIIGYSHYTISKLIDLLIKRGLVPEKYDSNKQVKARRI